MEAEPCNDRNPLGIKEEEDTPHEERFLYLFLNSKPHPSWLDIRSLIQLPKHRHLVPFEMLEGIHRVLASVTEGLQEIRSLLQQQLVAKQDTLRPVRWHRFKPKIYFCSVFVFTCCLYLRKRIRFS